MAKEPYVAQLLPSLKEARLIRKALMFLAENGENITEDETDMCYGITASLYRQMRETGR